MAGRKRIGKANTRRLTFGPTCAMMREEIEGTVMNRQSDEYDKHFPTKAEVRTRDAELAMQEYRDERQAMADKTARLRALRLARDASIVPAAKGGKPKG
jgi:hypothetical protein